MLKIRLLRVGRKHDPNFRVVITDSKKAPRSGAYLENLGFLNPRAKNDVQLNKGRIHYWLSKGAQVSDTVHNLLITAGIVKGKKVDVSAKLKKKPSSAKATAGKEEKPAESPEGIQAGSLQSESLGGEEKKEDKKEEVKEEKTKEEPREEKKE